MKVGIDLVEVARFENKNQSFFQRLFSKNEIEYCTSRKNTSQSFAGHFAAKEAVMKALGAGIDTISFEDIEILHLSSGKPIVNLFGTAKTLLAQFNIKHIEISISHTDGLATAICFAEEV